MFVKCHTSKKSKTMIRKDVEMFNDIICRAHKMYCTYSKHSDTLPIEDWRPLNRQLDNRVDPNQTPQKAASDQGLHCLQIFQTFFFRNIYLIAAVALWTKFLRGDIGSSLPPLAY